MAILDTTVLFTASLEFNLPDLLFPWERKRAVYYNNPHATGGDRKGQEKRQPIEVYYKNVLQGEEMSKTWFKTAVYIDSCSDVSYVQHCPPSETYKYTHTYMEAFPTS
jgi:hypothetical protein